MLPVLSLDSPEVVYQSVRVGLFVCQPGSPMFPVLYTVSVWLRNKPAFMLESRGEQSRAPVLLIQPYPIASTYSIRPRVQSQAQPTATYYVPLSPRTTSLYLCFSLTNRFVIYVSFLKPLMPQAAVAVMDLTPCIRRDHKTPLLAHARARSNVQMHRCLAVDRCEIFC